jgi:hypothetical protein
MKTLRSHPVSHHAAIQAESQIIPPSEKPKKEIT